MNNYQIFHRGKVWQQNNRLIQANKERMLDMFPDLVVDFAQCPRLFLREPFADLFESLNLYGVEMNRRDAQVDLGTTNYRRAIDDCDYRHFHVFNRYDVIDEAATAWVQEGPGVGHVEKPVIDEAKLNAIPQEERLMFKLDQDPYFLFVHNSLVDKLLDENMQDIWVRWGEGYQPN